MDNVEEKMNAILENPEMMQKIMAMANGLNAAQQETPPTPNNENLNSSLPDIDFSMVQKLSGLAGKSSIDGNQRTLLKALTPYLSRERISKLEKAMRAAKMAGMASVLLNQTGFKFSSGR